MNSKYIIVLIIVLVIIGGIYFFNYQSPAPTTSVTIPSTTDNGTSATVTTNPSPVTPAPVTNQVVHNVSISGFAFVPATITVRKGDTIVWTNMDTVPHTVTGGDLKSNPLGQGQTYSFAYDRTGTFQYACSLHPSMKGTVIVTN